MNRGYRTSFGPPVTPQIVKHLMIANAVVFVVQALVPAASYYGTVIPALVWPPALEVWRPFTYMWLHGGVMHLALNMFALWMFGSALALHWGEQRFLRYYLTCGIGAGALIATVPMLPLIGGWGELFGPIGIPTLGASGAVFGVLLAFSFTWPDRTIQLLFPPIPLKAIWLIPIVFVMTLFMGGSNISHIGHLGGVLVGWLYLRRSGNTGPLFSMKHLKYRWRRYRMRRNLRAVRAEEFEQRRRRNDRTSH